MDDNLSSFGELFIGKVRDNSIFVIEGVISGHMKSPIDKQLHDKVSKFSKEDLQLLKDFLYRMVDLTLHNTLLMLEENSEWVLANSNLEVININDLSDGLTGELYSDEGWIRRFSKFSPSIGL